MTKDIVVVGASAGGVPALVKVLAGLAKDLPASLFVVLHVRPYEGSNLADVLQRRAALRVVQARRGEPIEHGHVYVARPDHHLVIDGERILTPRSPHENRVRPAVDVLFRSAAYSFGPRVIGVVLTGMLNDGTSGLWTIKDKGGTAIVQDPRDAEFPSMPESAVRHVDVDHVKPLPAMAELISELVRQTAGETRPAMSRVTEIEVKIAKGENALMAGSLEVGKPSRYTCPECHGVLAQIEEGRIVRFRCHTGHAYSLESLLVDVSKSVEDALWSGLRVLEEKLLLMRQAAALQADQPAALDERLRMQIDAVAHQCELVREALKQGVSQEDKAATG